MVRNTCVGSDKIYSQNVEECDGKQVNLLNGKANNQDNGYSKATHLNNGVTVSRRSFISITILTVKNSSVHKL